MKNKKRLQRSSPNNFFFTEKMGNKKITRIYSANHDFPPTLKIDHSVWIIIKSYLIDIHRIKLRLIQKSSSNWDKSSYNGIKITPIIQPGKEIPNLPWGSFNKLHLKTHSVSDRETIEAVLINCLYGVVPDILVALKNFMELLK